MADLNIDVVSSGPASDVAILQVRDTLKGEIESTDVFTLVRGVNAKLGGTNKINRLRIWGHGAPGLVAVGTVPRSTTLQKLSQTDLGKLIAHVNGGLLNEGPLSGLRGKFGPRGWVELHACQAARGAEGERLLQALANLWLVSVKGGDADQFIGGGMEGNTIVARPGARIERR